MQKPNKTKPFDGYLPSGDCFALADCAARAFADQRTSRNPAPDDAKVRMILRGEPVNALRYLWKTGDADQRTTVACRILVWMGKKPDHKKIIERERNRLENVRLQTPRDI